MRIADEACEKFLGGKDGIVAGAVDDLWQLARKRYGKIP
jgi:hypothetical protein